MHRLAILAAGLLAAAAPGFGGVIFSDDFNTSRPASQLNTTVPNWTVTGGTIDYIKMPNQWGIVCAGGAGGCLDMDGSTGQAGTIESSLFNFVQGMTYTLSYDLSGNQRSGRDAITVSVGGVSQSHVSSSNDPFSTYSISFSPLAASTGRIVFSHAGGDNIGMILDNVSLSSTAAPVPEPSSFAMMGAGALALGYWVRRTRK